MAAVRTRRTIQWAGVEFQPNLQKPVKPIRLGAVLVETKPRSQSTSFAVIGRMPFIDSRPPGFKDVGEVTMNIAARWVDSMFKDMIDLDREDVFEKLAQRWRWNLYLRDVKRAFIDDHRKTFEAISRQLYEKYVGLPFKEPQPITSQNVAVPLEDVPPPWQLEGLNRLRLGQPRGA
jgi:hypothetical protein